MISFLKPALVIATAMIIPSLSFALGDWGDQGFGAGFDFGSQTEGTWTCQVVDFSGQTYEASGADEREACSQAIYNCSNTAADGNCDIVSSSDHAHHPVRHHRHHGHWN